MMSYCKKHLIRTIPFIVSNDFVKSYEAYKRNKMELNMVVVRNLKFQASNDTLSWRDLSRSSQQILGC